MAKKLNQPDPTSSPDATTPDAGCSANELNTLPAGCGVMGEELPRYLTYAAVVDVRNVEHEITDWKVRKACREMEEFQQFPFAARVR